METKKSDQHSSEKPLEPVHEAVRQETASPRKRSYRALAFQIYILVSLIAFAALAFMASVFQVNNFDVNVTREIQTGLPAWLGTLLVWVSWIGYATQSIVVTFSGMNLKATAQRGDFPV